MLEYFSKIFDNILFLDYKIIFLINILYLYRCILYEKIIVQIISQNENVIIIFQYILFYIKPYLFASH